MTSEQPQNVEDGSSLALPSRQIVTLDLLDSWIDSTPFAPLPRANPWLLGLTAFSVYYLLPLAVSGLSGTLLHPANPGHHLNAFGNQGLALWLSRSTTLGAQSSAIYYLSDAIHLLMALVTACLGTALVMTALQRFPVVLDYLIASAQLQVTDAEVIEAVNRARSQRDHLVTQLVIGGSSLILTTFIGLRLFDEPFRHWWGHAEHGLAGGVFAFAVGSMVWIGATAIHRLAIGLQLIAALFRRPVVLRPFHPDGCNGFAVFGDFLILLFFLSVVVAGSVSITFFGGYLGVEEFVGTWIVGAAILTMIPLVLIVPLIRCTIQISRAKHARLAKVEALLHRGLVQIEEGLSETSDPRELKASLEQLLHTRDTMAAVYGSNNFPFKPKIVGFVSATYVMQVVLLAREALEKFA